MDIIQEIRKAGSGKFCDAKFQMDYWTSFFKQQKQILNTKGKILDYGAGGGYAIYIGQKMGYNIEGLDIDQEKLFGRPMFNRIKNILGVGNKIIIYDGEMTFPIKDNTYDFIISRNSIRKDLNFKLTNKIPKEEVAERKKKRVDELVRITKPGGTWIIIPPNNKAFINANLKPNDKKIKVIYTK